MTANSTHAQRRREAKTTILPAGLPPNPPATRAATEAHRDPLPRRLYCSKDYTLTSRNEYFRARLTKL